MSNFDPSALFDYKDCDSFFEAKFVENLNDVSGMSKLILFKYDFDKFLTLVKTHDYNILPIVSNVVYCYGLLEIFKSDIFKSQDDYKLGLIKIVSELETLSFPFTELINYFNDEFKIIMLSNINNQYQHVLYKKITNPSSTVKDYIRLKTL